MNNASNPCNFICSDGHQAAWAIGHRLTDLQDTALMTVSCKWVFKQLECIMYGALPQSRLWQGWQRSCLQTLASC